MKESGENNYRAKHEYDLPATTKAPALSELVGLIDNEISAALRFRPDDDSLVGGDEDIDILGRYICAEVGENRMAFPMTGVLEAGELQVVQPLPQLPYWLTGITAIRGEIISVINLGRFLGINDNGLIDGKPYLVVSDDEIKTAISVDRILGTHSLYRLQTNGLTNAADKLLPAAYLAGWAFYQESDVKMRVSLFNLNNFLSSNRFRNLSPDRQTG